MTIRLVILVVTYLLIAVRRVPLPRLNRPAAALLGAVAMVTIGGLPMREAYAAIDLDVVDLAARRAAMANLIVAERAEALGEHIGFVEYLRVGAAARRSRR